MQTQGVARFGPLAISSSSSQTHRRRQNPLFANRSFRISHCSFQYQQQVKTEDVKLSLPSSKYNHGIFDDLFLNLFRKKMVQEVGWDSEKPGYDGLVEVANHIMTTSPTNDHAKDAAIRILRSLFPPLLLELYKILIAPLAEGKIAAMMVARVTAVTCEWLMGKCDVNAVDLPDGTSCSSGVFVERCKYLEESKCVGICVNTCKLPTQAFFMDYMGVPLVMEPNFQDYSCQFKFGVSPPLPEDDTTLKEPCLDICPIASRRSEVRKTVQIPQCPKA